MHDGLKGFLENTLHSGLSRMRIHTVLMAKKLYLVSRDGIAKLLDLSVSELDIQGLDILL